MSLTWQKPSIGYTWEDCGAVDEDLLGRKFKIPNPPYLVEKDYSQDMIVYQPFDDSTIFANFADIEPSPDTFAQWASKYGPLVGAERLKENPMIKTLLVYPKECVNPQKIIHHMGLIRTLGNKGEAYAQPSESLQFWSKEHEELRTAFLLWELANLKDTKTLERLIEWNAEKNGVSLWKIGREHLSTVDMDRVKARDKGYIEELTARGVHLVWENLFDAQYMRPWASKICRYPDVIKPALLHVQLHINKKLQEYPLNFAIHVDEWGKTSTVLNPTSLLFAMWYQFLLAFREDVKLRRCDVCGKWEDMKNHRDNWHRHKSCASVQRVIKSRRKAKEAGQE
jgi:hypothetical protein